MDDQHVRHVLQDLKLVQNGCTDTLSVLKVIQRPLEYRGMATCEEDFFLILVWASVAYETSLEAETEYKVEYSSVQWIHWSVHGICKKDVLPLV